MSAYGDIPTYLARFPIGAEVTAYYDPDEPKEAVLNKAGSVMTNLFACLGFCAVVAIAIYYRFFKLEA